MAKDPREKLEGEALKGPNGKLVGQLITMMTDGTKELPVAGTATIVRKINDRKFIILTSCYNFKSIDADNNEKTFIKGQFFLRRDGNANYAAKFKIVGEPITNPSF